jgi:hypothetical protein
MCRTASQSPRSTDDNNARSSASTGTTGDGRPEGFPSFGFDRRRVLELFMA